MLAFDNPQDDPFSWKFKILEKFDLFFAICFAVEMFLKIIAFGFIWNQSRTQLSYLLNPWNSLDFVVAVVFNIFKIYNNALI